MYNTNSRSSKSTTWTACYLKVYNVNSRSYKSVKRKQQVILECKMQTADHLREYNANSHLRECNTKSLVILQRTTQSAVHIRENNTNSRSYKNIQHKQQVIQECTNTNSRSYKNIQHKQQAILEYTTQTAGFSCGGGITIQRERIVPLLLTACFMW